MPKSDFQNEVINRVRFLRLENHISQMGLARLLEVSNGQIGNIESPKFSQKYTIKHLYILSKHFNVSFSYIITGEHKPLDVDTLIQYIIKYD